MRWYNPPEDTSVKPTLLLRAFWSKICACFRYMMVLKTGLKVVKFYAGHDHVNRHWDVLWHDRLSYIIVTTLHSSLIFSQAQLPRTVLPTALALGHVGKRWESLGKALACRWEGRGRGQALLSDVTTTNTGASMQTRAQKYHLPKPPMKLCFLLYPSSLYFRGFFLYFQIYASFHLILSMLRQH